MQVISQAHNQWASRPNDQRFWNLDDMLSYCKRWKEQSIERKSGPAVSKVVNNDGELALESLNTGSQAQFTHHSFGQLCTVADAPARYLRKLPSDLVADCLNHGIEKNSEYSEWTVLLNQETKHLRSITSTRYGRIWDVDVVREARKFAEKFGLVNPRAWQPWGDNDVETRIATKDDVFPCSIIREGDKISPSGLYASDRDCFIFLVDPNRGIEVNNKTLYRGCILTNSEVGNGRCAEFLTFLFSTICGNHYITGASNVYSGKVKHSGDDAEQRFFGMLSKKFEEYVGDSANEQQSEFDRLLNAKIADDEDSTIDVLFNRRLASKKLLTGAYKAAYEHPEDGHLGPNTQFGMMAGLTRVAQEYHNTDERMAVDRVSQTLSTMGFN